MTRKIALVSTFYEKTGGVSTFVRNIERELSDNKDFCIEVVSPDRSEQRWPNGKIMIITKAYHEIVQIKPDQIHCHCAWYLQLAALLYKMFHPKTKVITFKHSDVQLQRRLSLARRVKLLLDRNSDKVVFVSRYLKRKWTANISPQYGAAEYIRGGAVLPVKTDLDKLTRRSETPVVLTYVGLYEYEEKVKGVETLVEAFEVYVKKTGDVTAKLYLIGRGYLIDRVRDAVVRSNVSKQIIMLVNVDNPTKYYLRSNLHCHITYQDTTPIVIMEALALATPVLASNVCGIPEIEAQGIYLVNNDVDEIADAITTLIANPPALVQLSDVHSWRSVSKDIAGISNSLES